jgi:hypothetical protein
VSNRTISLLFNRPKSRKRDARFSRYPQHQSFHFVRYGAAPIAAAFSFDNKSRTPYFLAECEVVASWKVSEAGAARPCGGGGAGSVRLKAVGRLKELREQVHVAGLPAIVESFPIIFQGLGT